MAIERDYRATADELRGFIEQYEMFEGNKQDYAGYQKDVMTEAKSRGYDTAVMRKIIALRKREITDVQEEEDLMELYKDALGM